MNMNPLISFIIPVYNRQEQIVHCINSILSSDFEDYEIILIDDASTDNTPDVCCRYTARYSNIHYFAQPENKGPGAARNMGIAKAKGEFVYFLDSDDQIATDLLSDFAINVYQNSDSNVFITGYKSIGGSNGSMEHIFSDVKDVMCKDYNFRKALAGHNFVCFTFCVRRDFIMRHSILFPDTFFYEDTAFVSQLLFYCDHYYIYPKVLYLHFTSGFSSRLSVENGRIHDRLDGLDKLLQIIHKLILNTEENSNSYLMIAEIILLKSIIYSILHIPYDILYKDCRSEVEDRNLLHYPINYKNCSSLECIALWFNSFYKKIYTKSYQFKKSIYFSPAGNLSRNVAIAMQKLGVEKIDFLDNYSQQTSKIECYCPNEKALIVLVAKFSVCQDLALQFEGKGLRKGEDYISIWDIDALDQY